MAREIPDRVAKHIEGELGPQRGNLPIGRKALERTALVALDTIRSARAEAFREAAGVAEEYDGPGLEHDMYTQLGDAGRTKTDIAAALRHLAEAEERGS